MIQLNENSQVGVIGSGTMGTGIAQLASTSGHQTVLYDVSKKALKQAEDKMEKILTKLVGKEKLTEEQADQISGRIKYSSELKDMENSSLIIEAVVEDPEVKAKVFKKIDKLTKGNAVLATNTSSLSIASISENVKHPQNVVGIHFFNPAPVMPLVEIVPSLITSESILVETKLLIDNWGKTTVVTKDTPGFIVNRIARPFYGEALRILEEGTAGTATIDWIMRELGGFKMGPFELMDFIGNDVNYSVNEKVFEQMFYDPRYRPSITHKRLVEAGLFGRKTGIGFYDYRKGAKNPEPKKDRDLGKQIFYRIIYMLINEAADALRLNIASKNDIETAMLKGVNYPKGLLKWADELGIEEVLTGLELLQDDYGDDRYRPSILLRKMALDNKRFFKA